MNSQKVEFHQMFGVLCFVFSIVYMKLYQFARMLNTKHQIRNTFVKNQFSDYLRECQI